MSETPTPTVKCDDCGNYVELIRKENRTLALACDCPELVSIRVGKGVPEAWKHD